MAKKTCGSKHAKHVKTKNGGGRSTGPKTDTKKKPTT